MAGDAFRAAAANAKGCKPPKVAGRWPVVGHLRLFGGRPQPSHIPLGALADNYGPVFTINIGVHPVMVVTSWEAAKECFTTNDLIISSRPKTITAEILSFNYAMLGFKPIRHELA
ncbi:hypothetical protein C1H46_016610 [Malus baccata]|uniref:Cytochrome P450 n=1 Tax=Malus baccata TaxID=106549 RepID=A0A540MG88_MALBA|nr:hypothetical protein C1H46_016610 [Malus baccata]